MFTIFFFFWGGAGIPPVMLWTCIKKIAPGRIWWKHIEFWRSNPDLSWVGHVQDKYSSALSLRSLTIFVIQQACSLYIQMNGRHTFLFNLGWEIKLGTWTCALKLELSPYVCLLFWLLHLTTLFWKRYRNLIGFIHWIIRN